MSESVRVTPTTSFSTSDEEGRNIVTEVSIVFHGLGPEGDVNGSRPSVISIKEGCAYTLGDFAYATLSFSILVVHVDAAERKSLMSMHDIILKFLRIEKTIIAIVVTDVDIM